LNNYAPDPDLPGESGAGACSDFEHGAPSAFPLRAFMGGYLRSSCVHLLPI